MKGFKRFLTVLIACVCMCCFFIACDKEESKKNIPATVAEATTKMEAAGYEVEEVDEEELAMMAQYMGIEGATAMIECDLETDTAEEYVTVIWFAEESQAKAYKETVDAQAASADSEEVEGMVWGYSGKIAYAGSTAAVEALTK